MNFIYSRSNILRGLLIYASGDTVATLLQNQFSFSRMLGMMVLGATIYAFEIPNYFRWLDGKLVKTYTFKNSLQRTLLSLAYFSPLWITRHLFFIKLFSGNFQEITWDLFRIATISFVVNLPVSLTANYLIQNKVPYRHRFMASALFSAVMAVYFALAANWFK
ncbi:hypothetical protein I5M27_03500 [Adhaeribacter sp. BT258]|uniref:GtrA-like protein domain-containing protein n=1 Tax=Adhaeribacter terrigena TaxID=2793070 RepID=A0ABS1C0I6_9BACT|nr:hypothetical protein [Adhaeribacter terrigena]MBK0402035.1 hypothetical protein [Adhaeribacter terrigena]